MKVRHKKISEPKMLPNMFQTDKKMFKINFLDVVK
jgi:hypothetical protein